MNQDHLLGLEEGLATLRHKDLEWSVTSGWFFQKASRAIQDEERDREQTQKRRTAEYTYGAEKAEVLESQNHLSPEQAAEDGSKFFFDYLLPVEVMLLHRLSQTAYPRQETICVTAVLLFVFRAEFFTEETLFFKHDAHVYQ